MTFPGPPALGRGVVVLPGQDPPAPAGDWPRVVVDGGALADPAPVVSTLHRHWLGRQPVTVVLSCEPGELRAPETEPAEPWRLEPGFCFERERLQFLLWANNWDARRGEPVWWWARKAARLGAREAAAPSRSGGSAGDVTLPDGRPAWVDGGPRQPLDGPLGAVVHREAVEGGSLVDDGGESESTAFALAPDQLAAVRHEVGPARVIAPAGSGKTRVLTERLRLLLAERRWAPRSVMALAFNVRAADEMRERTAGLGAHIRTLNSLGLAILNGTGGFASPAGRPPRRVIEEPEVRRLLDDLVTLPRSPNTDPHAAYLEGLRQVRLALRDPGEVEEELDAPGLAEVFPRYLQVLEDRDLIDLDGQLYEAVRVLLTDPGARQRAQLLSRHLLVDEFQDLTPVHLLVIRLLAAPTLDVFGVGDDDQVIYGFAGATPGFLIDFERYFPGAAPYALEVNYRCPPAVVGAASDLLSYNERRIPKRVRAAPGREPVPGELAVRPVGELEVAETVAALLEAWHEAGEAWEQMAVLARVNAALLPVQVLFGQRGIPSRHPLDASILSRTGIRAALAYLRIGLSPGRIDAADLAETIRRPSRRISRKVVEMLTRRGATSLADIRRLAARLTGSDGPRLVSYGEDVGLVVAAAGRGTREALQAIRVQVGLGQAMDELDAARREADRSTHADDLAALEQVAALHPEAATFEDWLREVLSRPGQAGGAEVSTIHRVKGREWDAVVVFGLDEGLLPHRLAGDEAEERRLLHVALTRGRRRVVIVADRDRPSPFLDELDGSRPQRAREQAAVTPARRAREQRPRGHPAAAGGEGGAVLEALKAWRRERARRDGVPAYVVFNDAELAGVAGRRPSTVRELAACRGVGARRLELYGDEVLRVVEDAAGSGGDHLGERNRAGEAGVSGQQRSG